ncbi:hypothetical protein [Runella zeae]|uniref:hypothetical protein n=1 Tax=Runella zeae TaxID=94255 RepID=UPI002352F637|nr:hypothetical protein [Runella zeae]
MRRSRKPFMVVLLMMLLSVMAKAQVINIDLKVSTQRTLSRLDELQELARSGDVLLTLTNLTNQQQTIQLEVLLSSPQTDFRILTNPDTPTPAIYTFIPPNQVKAFTPTELAEELFDENSLVLGNGQLLSEFLANDPTGQIPTGTYQLCVRVRPESLNQQLNNTLSNLGCANLTFQQYTAPLVNLISNIPCVTDGMVGAVSILPPNAPFPITFTPPTFGLSAAIPVNFRYTVYIIKVNSDNSGEANQFIQSLQVGDEPRNWIVKQTFDNIPPSIGTGTIILQPEHFTAPGLEFFQNYALAIKAESIDNPSIKLPNGGLSPVYLFKYGEHTITTIPVPDCGQEQYDYNPPVGPTIAEAGIDIEELYLKNTVPLQLGYYEFSIKNITSSRQGRFSGEGQVSVPWLGTMGYNFLLDVEFEDIEIKIVNRTYYVTEGMAWAKLADEFKDHPLLKQYYDTDDSSPQRRPLADTDGKIKEALLALRQGNGTVFRTGSDDEYHFPLMYRPGGFTKVENVSTSKPDQVVENYREGAGAICALTFMPTRAVLNAIFEKFVGSDSVTYELALNLPASPKGLACFFPEADESKQQTNPISNLLTAMLDDPECGETVEDEVLPANLEPVPSSVDIVGVDMMLGYYAMHYSEGKAVEGKHSGQGLVMVPWAKNAFVKTTFEGVEIKVDPGNGFWISKGEVKAIPTEDFPLPSFFENWKTVSQSVPQKIDLTAQRAETKALFSLVRQHSALTKLLESETIMPIPYLYKPDSVKGKLGNALIVGLGFYENRAVVNVVFEHIPQNGDTSKVTYIGYRNLAISSRGIDCLLYDDNTNTIIAQAQDPDSPPCGSAVEATIPPGGEPIVEADVTLKSTIKFGYFSVTTNAQVRIVNGKLEGEGTVNIPFLKAKLKVVFHDVKVKNIQGHLYAIEGYAEVPKENIGLNVAETLFDIGDAPVTGKIELPSGVVRDVFNGLRNIGRLYTQLTDETARVGMPIAITTTLGDEQLNLGIFAMRFYPTRANFNVMLETPSLGEIGSLYVGARNVGFSPNGMSAANTSFYLGGDLRVPLGGIAVKLKGSPTQNGAQTFVKLGCNASFEKVKVVGEIELDSNWVRPTNQAEKMAKVTFDFDMTKPEDLLAKASITPLYFTEMPDFKFSFTDVSLDWSTTRNPADLVMTAQDRNSLAGVETLWHGIYAKDVSASLSDTLFGREVRLGVKNFTFSFTGSNNLSFTAYGANLITTGGSLAGFGFSLDTIAVSMNNGLLTPPVLEGTIRFPLFDDPLKYAGTFNATDRFVLTVTAGGNNNTMRSSALKSEFQLSPNVPLLTFKAKGMELTGDFSGKWSVVDPETGVNFKMMTFQGLKYDRKRGFDTQNFVISFASPQKYVGSTETSSSNKASGFPVTIGAKGFTPVFSGNFFDATGARCGLKFSLYLNLVGNDGSSSSQGQWGFGAETTLEVSAKGTWSAQRKEIEWSDPKVNLEAISIDVDVSVCHIKGALKFFNNDSIYGNGVRGCIDFQLKEQLKISVKGGVQGMFGVKDDYRYFYLDGYIDGLQIKLGQYLAISGFVGGLAYNMRQNGLEGNGRPNYIARFANGAPCDINAPAPFVPAEGYANVAFGVKFKDAGAGLAYNGIMGFGVGINLNTGGIQELGVFGQMNFVRSPDTPPGPSDLVKIRADLQMAYDFEQGKLTGNFDVYLNVVSVIKGSMDPTTGLAGRMVMYADNNHWMIWLGNPWGEQTAPGPDGILSGITRYAGVSLKIANQELARSSAYFCIGNYPFPGLPDLPEDVPRDLRHIIDGSRPRLDPRVSNGGIAFGASFHVGFDIDLAFLKAMLDMGAGFDLALVKYEEGAVSCNGTSSFGLNGFYARGRAYGYVRANLSIVYDESTYTLAEFNSYIFANFGGPNPTWLEGQFFLEKSSAISLIQGVAGYSTGGIYSLVDWATEGKLSETIYDTVKSGTDELVKQQGFETSDNDISIPFKIGTKCEPNAAASFNDKWGSEGIIAYITPDDNQSMDPYGRIEVFLNQNLYKTWKVIKDNGNGNFTTYTRHWYIKKAELVKSTGVSIPLREIATEGNKLTYQPSYANGVPLLQKNDRAVFTITLGIKEKVNTGEWYTKNYFSDRSRAEDERVILLKITEITSTITDADIAMSYPRVGEQYYLQSNAPLAKAFIKLNKVLPQFDRMDTPEYSLRFFTRIVAQQQLLAEGTFSYHKYSDQTSALKVSLPSLPNGVNINVEFWVEKTPKQSNSASGPNGGTAVMSARNVPVIVEKTNIYTWTFKTSQFNMLSEKLGQVTTTPFVHDSPTSYIIETTLRSEESWDNFELAANGQGLEVSTRLNSSWHLALKPIVQARLAEINAALEQTTALTERVTLTNNKYILEGLLTKLNGQNVAVPVSLENGNTLRLRYEHNHNIANFLGAIPPPTDADYSFYFVYKYPVLETNGSISYQTNDVSPAPAQNNASGMVVGALGNLSNQNKKTIVIPYVGMKATIVAQQTTMETTLNRLQNSPKTILKK